MIRTASAFALSAGLATGALMLGVTDSHAGHREGLTVSVGIGITHDHGHHHWGHYPHVLPHPYSGPELYYSYHYDHVPAYPVPIYRTDEPVVVLHRVRTGYGGAHVEWCYARYRSYRAWDNTFQPYHGPRRQCWSPYS